MSTKAKLVLILILIAATYVLLSSDDVEPVEIETDV